MIHRLSLMSNPHPTPCLEPLESRQLLTTAPLPLSDPLPLDHIPSLSSPLNTPSPQALQSIAPVPTTIALKATPRRASVGQPVLLKITVISQSSTDPTPSGMVVLYDGKRKFAKLELIAGHTQCTTSNLKAGRRFLTAVFIGNDSFQRSVSQPRIIDIIPLATTLSLQSSAKSVPQGRPVTFTATLTPQQPDPIKPTGWVTFKAGSQVLGHSLLTGSEASFTTSSLAPRRHVITAEYSGDSRFQTSISTALAQTITPADVVDLLALYTPDARIQIGNADIAQEMIIQAVNDTNLAFTNSHIPVTIRLVYAGEVDYHDSGQYETDLDHLAFPDDGYLDEIHSLRDRYGADLVSLFVGDGDLGGIAYQIYSPSRKRNEALGFSVVRLRQAADPFYTLAHELGHNFGAAHDTDNSETPGVFPDSYGYRFKANGVLYHDIMSYDPGQTIPYFSNPDVTYLGVPVGQIGRANTARTITQTAPYLAAYRPTVLLGVTPTTIALSASLNTSTPGQSVLLSATVAPRRPNGGLPLGKVAFKAGDVLLGYAKLSSGTARLLTSKIPPGSQTITALYLGDSTFAPTTSLPLSHTRLIA